MSRVTANKTMAAPPGLFELRYFFTAAIAGTGGGEVHSAEAVRHRLKALIDAEDPGGRLSDDKLADAMRVEGIDIAPHGCEIPRGDGHPLLRAAPPARQIGSCGKRPLTGGRVRS